MAQPGAGGSAPKRPVGHWLIYLAALSVFAILIALGFWQLERLKWKEDLISRIEAGLMEDAAPAPPISGWAELNYDEADYRRVEMSGMFLPGDIYYYGSMQGAEAAYGGPGYFVYSPFLSEDRWRVLVNRGFVPFAQRDPAARLNSGAPESPMKITGFLRRPQIPNFLTPQPDINLNIWFSRTPATMIAALPPADPAIDGLPFAPFTIDLERTSPALAQKLPVPDRPAPNLPNNHLQYALTWFSLAIVLAVMLVIFQRATWRRDNQT